MRKIVLTALPYFALGFLILLISIIWWPVNGGLVQLTNSWVGFFFICSFCVVFLFQEEIYIFLINTSKALYLYQVHHSKNIEFCLKY